MPTHEITLDVHKRTSRVPPQVVVRMGDAGTEVIRASITDDGEPYTSSRTNVRLDVLHADGTWARVTATKSGSTVTCTLPSAALSSHGLCKLAHFVFYTGSTLVESTEGFELRILPNVDASDAASEAGNYDDTLAELWEKWNERFQEAEKEFDALREDVEEAIGEASEAAREASEAAAIAGASAGGAYAGTYAGKPLESLFASEISAKGNAYAWLQSRAKDGDFDGISIGDYIDVPVSQGANVQEQTVRYVVAAIDPYYRCGNPARGHHVVMAPNAPVKARGEKSSSDQYLRWRTTNDNNGTADVKCPYLCSLLHEWEVEDFLPALPAELQACIMEHVVLLEERYGESGGLTEPSDSSWQSLGKVWSLSEVEVCGRNAWSDPKHGTGFDCRFPYFSSAKRLLDGTRSYWWLRSVSASSSRNVCAVNLYGFVDDLIPTNPVVYPRPCFLIG